MSELGEVLKKARIERNLTLEQIQDQTKIRKRYLEALEEGDFEVLPGKFYVRAFIKNYAEAIGLDADEVLKYYEGDIPELHPKTDEVIPARKPQRIRSTSSEKFSKLLVNTLLWGFFILIIGVLWYYLSENNKTEPKQSDDTNITESSEAPALTAATPTPAPTATPKPEVVIPLAVTFTETIGEDEIYVISPASETYTLNVATDGGESWIEVYDGSRSGTRLYYATMASNESKSFTISEGAFLVVGRPGDVKLTVDEAVIDIGDSVKKRKRIVLKSATAE